MYLLNINLFFILNFIELSYYLFVFHQVTFKNIISEIINLT